MKYEVLLGPIQVTADTKANTGDIIDLLESDGNQLVRWGIVRPVEDAASVDDIKPPELPVAPPAATAKATTAEKTEPVDPKATK